MRMETDYFFVDDHKISIPDERSIRTYALQVVAGSKLVPLLFDNCSSKQNTEL